MFKHFIYRILHSKEIKNSWNKQKIRAFPVELEKRNVKSFYLGWRRSFIKGRVK